MNFIHVTIPPTTTRNGRYVTWTEHQFQTCLLNNPLGRGSLNAWNYCDALRWVDASPWDNPPISMGERRLPVFFPRLGLPQVVSKTAKSKEELLHEPAIGQVSASTQKVVSKMKKPKLGARRGDFVWDGEQWYNVVLAQQQAAATTGGDMASFDLGNITGRVIDIGLQALQSRVVRQPATQLALAGPAAKAAGAAAAATLGVTALTEIFDDDNDKHRHRRKRLATVSDIKDLAALKAVLGAGEAFKTWIATHSR